MTRVVLVALAVLLAVAPAIAGQNPDVRLFLTGSNTDFVDQVAVPFPYQPIHIYLVADCLGTGVTAVATTVTFNFPGYTAGDPVYADPAALAIGGINDAAGWSIAFTECFYPDPVTKFLVIADIFWSMGEAPVAGTAVLSAHPTQAKKITGCDVIADQYCIYQNLGIGTAPPAGEEPCDCEVPVDNQTWGAIKAMYR
jgi:hypothetical protein